MSKEDTEQSASLDDMFDDVIETTEDANELEAAPEDGQAETDAPEVTPLELPEYFPKANREHIEALQKMEGGRDYAEHWVKQWQENQDFFKKQQSEAEQYRQQAAELQQFQQALQPLNQIWQSQAIHPAMGVAQLAHYGQMLYSDPKGLINEIAQRSGLDLTQLVEEQPYIDPHVSEQLRTLQTQNQQFQQHIAHQQQAQQNQQNQAINQALNNFLNAKDESGNPKYPYIKQATPVMQKLLQLGQANTYEEAYEQAIGLSPEIQGEIKKAQDKAEAERKHKEAEKAAASSTRVKGKSKSAPADKVSMQNMFDDVLDDMALDNY